MGFRGPHVSLEKLRVPTSCAPAKFIKVIRLHPVNGLQRKSKLWRGKRSMEQARWRETREREREMEARLTQQRQITLMSSLLVFFQQEPLLGTNALLKNENERRVVVNSRERGKFYANYIYLKFCNVTVTEQYISNIKYFKIILFIVQ